MRIPKFEDLGNRERRVEQDEFFGNLAEMYVDAHVAGDVWAETPTLNDRYDYQRNPFIELRSAVQEFGIDGVKEPIKYRLRCQFQYLWNESYDREDGQELRDTLMRHYLKYEEYQQAKVARNN